MNNVEMPKYKRTEISIAAQIKSIEEIQVPIVAELEEGEEAGKEQEFETKEKLSFFDTAATIIVDGGWSEKNKAETGKFYIKESSDKEICRTSEWFHENYVKMPS